MKYIIIGIWHDTSLLNTNMPVVHSLTFKTLAAMFEWLKVVEEHKPPVFTNWLWVSSDDTERIKQIKAELELTILLLR